MDISELVSPSTVAVRAGVTTKRQLMNLLAELVAPGLGVPEKVLFDGLMEREALGSTGLGSGVAVPHARVPGLDSVKAVFVRLDTPVAYDAVDDRPVDLMFALFAAPDAGAEHLRALAAVSRALRSPELRERLRQAHTADAIQALFVRDTAATAA